jgi:metallophosphoesterase superfamily enzyme
MKVLIYSFCIVFSRRHLVLPSITAMSTARALRINSEEDPYLRVVLPERDPTMKGTDSERVRKVQRLKKMFY